MAYRVHNYARISSSSPEAVGLCDRCSQVRNLRDLQWQRTYAGFAVINTNLLVCDKCLDPLNPQDRPIITGADPLPVPNPRPLNMTPQETNNRATEVLDLRITEDDDFRITETTADTDG